MIWFIIYFVIPPILALGMGAGFGGFLVCLVFGWIGFIFWAIARIPANREAKAKAAAALERKRDEQWMTLVEAANPDLGAKLRATPAAAPKTTEQLEWEAGKARFEAEKALRASMGRRS